jgi:hypothetical protein
MQLTATPPVAPRFVGLPKHRPPVGPSRVDEGEGDEGFDWESLVPLFIHPAKVAVIEALHWIGQPLSSTELVNLFGHRKYNLGVVSYHVSSLAKVGVIEATGARQARGAQETYYFFPSSL